VLAQLPRSEFLEARVSQNQTEPYYCEALLRFAKETSNFGKPTTAYFAVASVAVRGWIHPRVATREVARAFSSHDHSRTGGWRGSPCVCV